MDFKNITDSDLTALNVKIYEKILPLCNSNGKSRDLKMSQICVIQNILHVTFAKTLTGWRLLLTLILPESLTVDPYNCWPLKWG